MSRDPLERDTTTRMRTGGTVGFALALFAGGALDGTAPLWLPSLLAAGAWAAVVWALTAPRK